MQFKVLTYDSNTGKRTMQEIKANSLREVRERIENAHIHVLSIGAARTLPDTGEGSQSPVQGSMRLADVLAEGLEQVAALDVL